MPKALGNIAQGRLASYSQGGRIAHREMLPWRKPTLQGVMHSAKKRLEYGSQRLYLADSVPESGLDGCVLLGRWRVTCKLVEEFASTEKILEHQSSRT